MQRAGELIVPKSYTICAVRRRSLVGVYTFRCLPVPYVLIHSKTRRTNQSLPRELASMLTTCDPFVSLPPSLPRASSATARQDDEHRATILFVPMRSPLVTPFFLFFFSNVTAFCLCMVVTDRSLSRVSHIRPSAVQGHARVCARTL
jgi:hypothetical protein